MYTYYYKKLILDTAFVKLIQPEAVTKVKISYFLVQILLTTVALSYVAVDGFSDPRAADDHADLLGLLQ